MHQYQGCAQATIPRTNVEYWTDKLLKNRSRDEAEVTELTNMGWHVIVVWECELKVPERQTRLSQLYDQTRGSMGNRMFIHCQTKYEDWDRSRFPSQSCYKL